MVPLEHIGVGSLAFLSLEEDVHLNFSILLSRFVVMYITFPVEVCNDYHAFFIVVVIQKPPNGL